MIVVGGYLVAVYFAGLAAAMVMIVRAAVKFRAKLEAMEMEES